MALVHFSADNPDALAKMLAMSVVKRTKGFLINRFLCRKATATSAATIQWPVSLQNSFL